MARKRLKEPSDSKSRVERNQIKKRPHYDMDCDVFAESHYGSYLIVQNTSNMDSTRKHNRFYFDHKKELEFLLKTGYGAKNLTEDNFKSKDFHLFSIFPKHRKLIQILISKIKRNKKRNTIRDLSYGINTMICMFKKSNINISDHPSEFNAEIHQKCLNDMILKGAITKKSRIKSLGFAWAYIRKDFNNSELGTLPSESSAEIQIEELFVEPNIENLLDEEGKDEVTPEILFQLDYYSQIELGRIIERAKEYQEWIRELDMNGKLFSSANLLKTYYNNTSRSSIRKLYILLYDEDPQCWNPYKISGNGRFYDSKTDELRHQKLIVVSKTGIDISINNEKIFAWWHKTLFPNWPFNKAVVEPYHKVFINTHSWMIRNAKAAKTSLIDFNERILPDIHTIYLMYLRLLIDTTANTDTASNTQVYKNENGNYVMGKIHHNLRMLDSIKRRSNTVPPSYIAKGTFTDQCVDFFTEWLKRIYEQSDSNNFLQYTIHSKVLELSSASVKTLNPQKKKNSRGNSFFEKHEIYKSVEKLIINDEKDDEIVVIKERVLWIKHKNIRAANNLKNYYQQYGEWVRAHVVLGQQSDRIEKDNYRNYSWKLGDEHQMAVSMLRLQKFIEGKIVDEKLKNVFNQPHCGCKDNTNPTFEGAPKINDGEVCTSWRYCLTRCDNSYVFPKEHAPTIMAWQILMDQERKSGRIIREEDWIKEYGEDYDATEIVISSLKPEDKEFAKFKADERIPFVRLMMMQTKEKRKVNNTIKVALNG